MKAAAARNVDAIVTLAIVYGEGTVPENREALVLPWWVILWHNQLTSRRALRKEIDGQAAKAIDELEQLSKSDAITVYNWLLDSSRFGPELRALAELQHSTSTEPSSSSRKIRGVKAIFANDAASLVAQAKSLVSELVAPRTSLVPQAERINAVVSRFNEGLIVFDSYEQKQDLVDSINEARDFLQLKIILTHKVGQMRKGTEIWLSLEKPSKELPTGRFIFQKAHTERSGTISGRSAHNLPVRLEK